jgi:hypothetical protein
MKRLLPLLAAATTLFLVGCAGTHQYLPMPDQSKTVDDPAKGRIYVLRPSSFGGAVGMNISDGGNPVGSTGPGGYLCWEREPGDVVVSSTSENTSRVSLAVRAGTVHYILQSIRMGIWVARTDLEVIDEAKAKAELKHCKPAKVEKPPAVEKTEKVEKAEKTEPPAAK